MVVVIVIVVFVCSWLLAAVCLRIVVDAGSSNVEQLGFHVNSVCRNVRRCATEGACAPTEVSDYIVLPAMAVEVMVAMQCYKWLSNIKDATAHGARSRLEPDNHAWNGHVVEYLRQCACRCCHLWCSWWLCGECVLVEVGSGSS